MSVDQMAGAVEFGILVLGVSLLLFGGYGVPIGQWPIRGCQRSSKSRPFSAMNCVPRCGVHCALFSGFSLANRVGVSLSR